MIDFPIIDSHVHLCDPERLAYSWTANAPSLKRRVLPADFARAAAPVQIDRFVFVEVDVDYPQHLVEAAWVDGLAQSQPKAEPRIAGLVAALPLEEGPRIEGGLQELLALKALRGVRRLIQNQPDPEFCTNADFIAALKLLAPHDLSFDICVFHHQLPSVIRMVRACPEVRFVLDHIGKPAIKAGILDPWRSHMTELASYGNVFCKISGVATEADHGNWTREQLKPYIVHAIEAFGFDRVMYGGDWHVLGLAAPYPKWVETLEWVIAGASAGDRRKLFRDNAVNFYRLER